MTATRDRRATRLLDPRWHWIQGAAQRIYAELDNDQTPAGLTLIVAGPDGGMIYATATDGPEVNRHVIADLDALEGVLGTGLVDVTPPASPGDPS